MSRWNQGPSTCIWIIFNFSAWHIRKSHVRSSTIVVHLFHHFLIHLSFVDIISLSFWRIPVKIISLCRKFLLHIFKLGSLLSSRALISLNLSLAYVWTERLLLTIHPHFWRRLNRILIMLLVLCWLITTRVLWLLSIKVSTSRPAPLLALGQIRILFHVLPFLAIIRLRVLMSWIILVIILGWLLLLLIWLLITVILAVTIQVIVLIEAVSTFVHLLIKVLTSWRGSIINLFHWWNSSSGRRYVPRILN